ncbi:MAG: hypothetical protein HZA63_13060 [Rhodocyclales bacterium]|nr:hypothetical protein [Rhodocyclales bacterium]
MALYLITIAFIFSLALGGILIDRIYRRFAARNPQLGPFRDPGKCGCCSAGSGCDSTCSSEPALSAMKHH